MRNRRLSLPACALLVGLGGFVAAAPAFAQTTPTAPATPPAAGAVPAPGAHGPWHEHRPSAERFVPGRIAFLKAELKITPQQEPQWTKVAEAMRINARDIDAVRAQLHAQPKDALQALEARSRFSEAMAKNNERLLVAFRPLYQSLSPDQKHMADEIMAAHFGGHHRHFD